MNLKLNRLPDYLQSADITHELLCVINDGHIYEPFKGDEKVLRRVLQDSITHTGLAILFPEHSYVKDEGVESVTYESNFIFTFKDGSAILMVYEYVPEDDQFIINTDRYIIDCDGFSEYFREAFGDLLPTQTYPKMKELCERTQNTMGIH